MNIIFWNVAKKNLSSYLISLNEKKEFDLIFLAEAKNIDPIPLEKNGFREIKCLSNLRIFTKYKDDIIKVIKESPRHSALKINKTANGDLLIFCFHLPSKVNMSDKSLIIENSKYASEVNHTMDDEKTEKTILLGDFNSNPFEFQMYGAGAFHATPNRVIASKNSRTIQDKNYRYFYNPMWKFFGNREEPFGTYYLQKSEPDIINWNILDQFLISPSLLNIIPDESFEIITSISNDSLLKNSGVIDKSISDHLPIFMSANI